MGYFANSTDNVCDNEKDEENLILCGTRGVSSPRAGWRWARLRTNVVSPSLRFSRCRTAGCWCSVDPQEQNVLLYVFVKSGEYKREEPHLDDAAVVVGEVRQRRLVLVQRVVAGVGVVMVVTVRNVCRNKTNL